MEEPDVPVDASGYTTPPAVDNDAPTATPSPSAETTDLPNNDLTQHGDNIANPDMDPMRDPDAPAEQRDDDADSVLSDLDDEAFADYNEVDIGRETIPIDADTVGAIGKFKKKRTGTEGQPVKRKERRVREKRGRGAESEDEGDGAVREQVVELTEEEKRRLALEKQMDDAVKGPKKVKKRKNDHDLERMDDEALENLRLAMVEAAERDFDCVEAGQPAIHKLGMLDDVRQLLSRQNMLNVALDGQILTGIRRWLEPLPNRSLPAYNVQKLMFEILEKLKPDTEHLRESGIGKIVTFYTKDVRPELHIKRTAEKLIRDWTRPILGRSDDYHSREIPVGGRGGDNGRPRPNRPKPADGNPALAAPRRNTGRASVPMPASQSYDIAPPNKVSQGYNQFARPAGAAGDDWIRRMKAKKQKKGGAN